jgi:hypothetical protein
MSTSKTGLSAFTSKTADKAKTVESQPIERKRGIGETVALSVRVKRSDWERIHQLAVSEGMSINSLAILGFSKIFDEKGMPPLNGMK